MIRRAWRTFDRAVRWLVWWLPLATAGALLLAT